jgi:hypothetical protein
MSLGISFKGDLGVEALMGNSCEEYCVFSMAYFWYL